MFKDGRWFRYAIAMGCAVWVVVFAAMNDSVMMLVVGIGMGVVTVLTDLMDVRRDRDGEWKE